LEIKICAQRKREKERKEERGKRGEVLLKGRGENRKGKGKDMGKREKGITPYTRKESRPDILVEWLASIGEARPHTLDAYTDAVFLRAAPYISGRHPGTVGPAEAELVVRTLRRQYAPATVNQTISALSSLWRHLQRRGVVADNPWKVVGRESPKSRVGERFLSREEVKKIILAAPSFRARTFLAFLYFTGARVSEAVRPRGTPENSPRGLRWRDIRFEADGWAYATLYGKGGKTRTVGVRPEVAALLEKLGQGSLSSRPGRPNDPVFPVTRVAAFLLVRHCAARAGINKPVSPHWLRHSHAVHALEAGAPVNLVQATLGHARLDTTGVYLRIRPGKGTGEYL
jgi:integrase/recombinase XerD